MSDSVHSRWCLTSSVSSPSGSGGVLAAVLSFLGGTDVVSSDVSRFDCGGGAREVEFRCVSVTGAVHPVTSGTAESC